MQSLFFKVDKSIYTSRVCKLYACINFLVYLIQAYSFVLIHKNPNTKRGKYMRAKKRYKDTYSLKRAIIGFTYSVFNSGQFETYFSLQTDGEVILPKFMSIGLI